VLGVAAGELGDPLALVVLVETGNGAIGEVELH
jgi:hypothetical protein